MGNNIRGRGSSKTTKVMKINGDIFKLNTPTKVTDVIKHYPNHILLDSDHFLRFNIRADPLDPDDDLQPNKIYLLVQLPQFPTPFRRVASDVGKSTKDIVKITPRSTSNLSMMTKSTVGVGPGRVRMRMPKVVVERIMKESKDEGEVAERIMKFYLEGDHGDNVVVDGGGHGDERECVVDSDGGTGRCWFSPYRSFYCRYDKLSS